MTITLYAYILVCFLVPLAPKQHKLVRVPLCPPPPPPSVRHFFKIQIQALKIRIQALKIRIQALKIQIPALKILIQALKILIQALKIQIQAFKTVVDTLQNIGGGGGNFQHVCLQCPFKICESFKYNAWYIKFIV